MLTSPYKTRGQYKTTYSNTPGTQDPSSPGNLLPKGTQLKTTVDNLLLPGVIGATVEGPKTPRRSPRVEPGPSSVQRRAQFNQSHSRMTPPPAYNDDQSDSDDHFFPPTAAHGAGRSKSETPKKDRTHHGGLGFRTPQPRRTLDAAEWRKKFRPHDTPNAREEHAEAPVSRSPLGRRTRQRSRAIPYNGLQEEQEEEEDEGEELDQHHQGLILEGHDSQEITRPNQGHMHTTDATDDDGVHMADDSGLDVGSDREGQDQSYDNLAYRNLSDAHAYSDEESLTHQIKREEYKEAKRRRRKEKARLRQLREEAREKNQLGFLRRLVNMFSPEDYGDDRSAGDWDDDDDDLSSIPESDGIDEVPLYPRLSSTPNAASTSASYSRMTANIATPSPRALENTHSPATLRQLSSHSSPRSFNNTRQLLPAEESRDEYYEPSDEDDLHSTGQYEVGLEAQDEDDDSDDDDNNDEEDLHYQRADHALEETLMQDEHQQPSRQHQQYWSQPQSKDSQRAVPRVYPWHVLARMSRQQYQHVRTILSSLAATVLDTALALRDGLAALLLALWATILTLCGGLSAWFKEGVNSGLFNPRTLMSVGLLMLAIIFSNVLVNSAFVERSWNSLTNTYRDPASSTLDLSAMMTAAMNKVVGGSLLTGRPSEPTRSVPWEADDSQTSPTVVGIPDLKFQKQQARRLEAIEARLSLIQKTLAQLDGADQELESQLKAQLKDLAAQISVVDSKVEHVIQDVKTLKQRLQSGSWLNQTVIEMIQDELPRYLVIAKDSATGQLKIPAEFWQMAREMFVTADEASQLVKDQMTKELANVLDGEIPLEERESDRAASEWRWISEFSKKRQKSRQWANFLKDHEKALNELVDQRQAVVSRQSFLGLVRTEAATIWRAIEPQAIPWLERHGHFGSSSPSSSSRSNNRGFTGGSILTEAEREAMSLLIDEALERYTADAIAKPDYALYSAGGRIIPKLTTNCEDLRWFGGVINLFLRPPGLKPPEYAIRPGTTPGECWAVEGDHGQLGVRLARHIIPTEVTVEHADMRVVLDMGSAPKDFELWGIPAADDATGDDGNSNAMESPSAGETPFDMGSEDTNDEETASREDKEEEEEHVEAPWPGAFLLTRGTYQIDASAAKAAGTSTAPADYLSHPRARQTFPIPLSKQNMPVKGVVFKIKSNWGHPTFTCLYRVRVHGHEP